MANGHFTKNGRWPLYCFFMANGHFTKMADGHFIICLWQIQSLFIMANITYSVEERSWVLEI